jgi:hypothetical protein
MKCTLNLLRFLLLALALPAAAGAGTTGGVDRTRAYLDAYAGNCAFGTAHAAALRTHKVLLVPGYFGNLDPGYYRDQLRWLASIGVERETVAVTPGRSAAINAAIVAAAIRAAAKPVILITHSKGSVDTLEALRAEPGLRKKIAGWVSLQGVFLGTPVADMLLDGTMLDPIVATVVIGFLGGSKDAADGLTTFASGAYYRDHAGAISRLIGEVPVIAFASAVDSRTPTLLQIPRELMARKGIRSDGLVPLDAAVLPGMDFVKVNGVDHIAPVMPALHAFDRVRMTKALLLTLRGVFRGLPGDAGCAAARDSERNKNIHPQR